MFIFLPFTEDFGGFTHSALDRPGYTWCSLSEDSQGLTVNPSSVDSTTATERCQSCNQHHLLVMATALLFLQGKQSCSIDWLIKWRCWELYCNFPTYWWSLFNFLVVSTKQATRTQRKEPEDREMKEKTINDLKAPKMHLLPYRHRQSMIIIYDCVNIKSVIYQLHWLTWCQYSIIKLRNSNAKTECIAAGGISGI